MDSDMAGLRRDLLRAVLTTAEDGTPVRELLLDAHCMDLPADWPERFGPALDRARRAMIDLEAGALANADEQRRVGHYWLRDPERAPTPELRKEIEACLGRIYAFAADVHTGRIHGSTGAPLRNLLVVGIGGSALGPQLAAAALGGPGDRMRPFFFDNTDPDGMDRALQAIARTPEGLAGTLVLVVSKSGGTKETRNGMLYAQAALREAGLKPAEHLVAVTGTGSELCQTALRETWRAIFPMWDWVGGRTSELSAVGLLPAALQGLDVEGFLHGAREMDALTRLADPRQNPAMLLAVAWHHATEGQGKKDMVVLPYKDRLELFSRYLQQLVMESLGKEHDRAGRIVNQGLSVYGNKGSTDQHAYVQQLRDGVPNFFVTFIEVLRDREFPGEAGAPSGTLWVEDGVSSGDYLLGFLLGTQRALYEKGRQSLTLTVPDASARSLGLLIALFERTVGLYAELVGVNAYHQPGVEAGKKAAAAVLVLQRQLCGVLSAEPRTASELAAAAGAPDEAFTAWKILEHLAKNGRVQRLASADASPLAARFRTVE
ncbi:MAG: glucose-6-phosphate isomerase [Polyangia bacterium]